MRKCSKYLAICLILMVSVVLSSSCTAVEMSVKVILDGSEIEYNKKQSVEGIYLEYDMLNVTGIELEEEPDAPNYIGYYWGPYIYGLGSEEFESYVHKYLADAITKPVREFEEDYNDFRSEIATEKDPEIKKDLMKVIGRYQYASQTRIVTTAENYCAVAEARFRYTGGAHGMTYIRMFNIDIPGEKFIKLGDIFKDGSYKSVIEKKLTEMAKTDKYSDVLFPNTGIKINDEDNFYLADGKLVIFYQLYDIAPFAAGFIAFDIPFSELSDILKDEYKTASYENELTEDQLFNKIFQEENMNY